MLKNRLNFNLLSRYRTEIMGVACIAVIFFHFNNSVSFPNPNNITNSILGRGNVGVEIFLFLSGIGLYFAYQKSSRLLPFYKKRLVRIAVPYLLICVPYYIWLNLCTPRNNLLFDIFQISLITENMRATWYMPAITLFYLIFPIIFLILNRKHRFSRFAAALTLCGLWIGFLMVFSRTNPALYKNTEIVLTRLVVFICGVFVGKYVVEKKRLPLFVVIASLIITVIYPMLFYKIVGTLFRERMTFVPYAIAISITLGFAFSFLKEKSLLLKILRFFGERSIEFYLTHIIINDIWRNYFGTRNFDSRNIIDFTIILIISFFASLILHPIINKISTAIIKK